MTLYSLNFQNIKNESLKKNNNFNGIYWNDIPKDIPFYTSIINKIKTMETFGYQPILYINEIVQDHFTQILFILKESYTDRKTGFTGWRSFTEEYLREICRKDYNIYRSEWGADGEKFVELFPIMIDEFIRDYCVISTS